MAPAIKDMSDLPDYAKPTAARIENLGFKWEFDYKYPIQAPDTVQRVQIRDAAHEAPPAEVTRYAAAMKRGRTTKRWRSRGLRSSCPVAAGVRRSRSRSS